MNTKYQFNTEWQSQYKEISNRMLSLQREPAVLEVENAVVLPSIPDEKLFWGKGGVLDSNGKLIESSVVKGAFGGGYKYDTRNLEYIDETMMYLGIMPLHWGHFLIDFLSKLWLLDRLGHSFRLLYIPRFFDGAIYGNFMELLALAGVNIKSLIAIKRPTKIKELIIPDSVMGFGTTFSKEHYRNVTLKIADEALKQSHKFNLPVYEKIYFTRRNFAGQDIGEREIEEAFANNGFVVLSPERLSLVEQIHYINTSKMVASLSGTICHNFVFSKGDAELIMLNRHPQPNLPQFRINYIFDINCTWIDVYNKWQLRHVQEYGSRMIWVEFSNALKQFFKDRGWSYSTCRIYQGYLRNYVQFYSRWYILPRYWNLRSRVGFGIRRVASLLGVRLV